MPVFNFETFSEAAKRAFLDAMCFDDEVDPAALFDRKGPLFDFKADGGVDSLDMLDIVFAIDKSLGVKIDLERLVANDKPLTVQNLYDSTHEKIPA